MLREISVGAPNRDTSWALNSPTRWNTERRRSRAVPADVREAKKVAVIVAAIWMSETPSIHAPVCRM